MNYRIQYQPHVLVADIRRALFFLTLNEIELRKDAPSNSSAPSVQSLTQIL